MRMNWILAALAVLVLAGEAMCGDGGIVGQSACNCQAGNACGCYGGGDPCDPCDPCNGGAGCRLFGHHHNRHNGSRYEGLDASFNCGCNGSYKFPVPPLYTYHWPGMWSAQLMTDYHSPWRFPPLKPYTDEIPPAVMGAAESPSKFQPVSAMFTTPARAASEHTVFSRHLEQMGR